jgi:hypothetical protein
MSVGKIQKENIITDALVHTFRLIVDGGGRRMGGNGGSNV